MTRNNPVFITLSSRGFSKRIFKKGVYISPLEYQRVLAGIVANIQKDPNTGYAKTTAANVGGKLCRVGTIIKFLKPENCVGERARTV